MGTESIAGKNGGTLIPYSKDNPPQNPGRPPGTKNRRTIFREWLDVKTKTTDPAGNELYLSQADQVAIRMIEKAKNGDVNAAYFVFDSAFGKIATVTQPDAPPKLAFDVSKLTTKELDTLNELYSKATTRDNSAFTEAEIVTD